VLTFQGKSCSLFGSFTRRDKIDENFFKSMPDFEFRILNIAAKGEFVAAELVGVGTPGTL